MKQQRRRQCAPQRQRGITLIGLLFWAVIIGFFAVVGMKVLPTVNEFLTIKHAVQKIAKDGGGTVEDIRRAFERTKDVEYSIQSISAKDLDITKDPSSGDVVINFAYDKEIELMDPVFILIKYRGSSKP